MYYKLGDVLKGWVNPHAYLLPVSVYSWERGVRERETFIDTICGRRGWQDLGERLSLTKNDTYLTWKLSDDIVIVLCFDCHSMVLAVFSSLCCT